MSLDVAIATIVLLDLAILAGLAYVMAAPRHLTPHRPSWLDNIAQEFEGERGAPRFVRAESSRTQTEQPSTIA